MDDTWELGVQPLSWSVLMEVLAGVSDVTVHLSHEVVHGVEPQLVPQPVKEVDTDILAVDVAVEVKYERLHGGTRLGVEGGTDADVGAGEVFILADEGAGDVDTEGG